MENNTVENVATPTVAAVEVQKPKPQVADEKETPENVENTKRITKAKKRKKPKDMTAPRHPLSGYVRFLNDRREAVRIGNPTLSFAEITKILASEWGALPADKKQQYLEAAEQDRERYTREYNAYKQTDAYRQFAQQQNEKKVNNKDKETREEPQIKIAKENKDLQNNNETLNFSNFDIPIFTEEFLDHNKTRDAELRQLRKSNTDYEQQNATLQKHIESMKTAIEKLDNELTQQKKNNGALELHLDHLRNTLTSGFADVKLPGVKEVATIKTIDSYMTNLHSLLIDNSSQDASLLQTVREIVGKLEFEG